LFASDGPSPGIIALGSECFTRPLRDWFPRAPGKTTEQLVSEARGLIQVWRFEDALTVYEQVRRRERTSGVLVEMARGTE
jgi:hypothetical protein